MSQPAFDFGDVELDDPTNPTYTVGELAGAINDRLHRGFHDGVWVRGEIDDLTHRGPHSYFSLVEHGDGGKAVINVQLFAPMKRKLLPILKRNRLELRNGMKVRIHGHLDFWAQAGRLGLKMAGLDPRYTLGEIAQSRDEVLRRLVAEGLIDANRRLAIPPVPLRVGVAASTESAAWHDFRDELERSGRGFRLTVADTRVQGELAARRVAAAIATLSRRTDLDVVVVIRGGGARNELAVFDAEVIARAIAAAPVPVLTGLGHEIDRSIADDVAHTALKTPTACAGALVDRVDAAVALAEATWEAIARRAAERLDGLELRLRDTSHRLARHTHAAVERADESLDVRRHRLTATAPGVLARAGTGLDVRRHRLTATAPGVLARADTGLDRRADLLRERSSHRIDRETDRLDLARARVAALDPHLQLARGWTITRRRDGRLVRSASDVQAGDTITTMLVDGEVTSTVDGVGPSLPTRPTESEPSDD